ncbi:MAG: heparin lyase I family protein [Burkholderiales bacterium]|nr:heparin lyase I family protein [Burkholderiales bacterium]
MKRTYLSLSVFASMFCSHAWATDAAHVLCLNPAKADTSELYQFIENSLGKGAVESPSDLVYTPRWPHISLHGDADVPAYLAVLAREPGDVNLDGRSSAEGGDRSRTEIKIAPGKNGAHTAFHAHEGDNFIYAWRFKIDAAMKFSPSFSHLHQIKAYGGSYAEPPLITFTALSNDNSDGTLEIRHVADRKNESGEYQILGRLPLSQVRGRWITVVEQIRFSNSDGRYQVSLHDQDKALLQVDTQHLQLWRTGAEHMRPKWGIYRKHHAMLNQDKDDYVYFANIGITRGDVMAACP